MSQDFRHEALLYEGRAGFLSGAVPFIRAGLDAGEPILVAVGEDKLAPLRARFGESIEYADMAELGRNPARIIPAWHAFLERHDRPVRGIGEPIWRGRGAAELVECQLHEALLNVAFAETAGFTLLCPYDTSALGDGVVREARCSHPIVGGAASPLYRDAGRMLAPFETPLPPPPATARILGFEHEALGDVRRLVADCAERAGLSAERTRDLVLAAAEIASNSVLHGGGRGIVRVWREDGALVCELKDRGRLTDPLAGRHAPDLEQPDGRGLWLANLVCDLVQVRSNGHGTTVRLHMRQ